MQGVTRAVTPNPDKPSCRFVRSGGGIGVALACFGPALIVQGVHLLRSAKNEAIILIRNLVLLAGLGKLTINIWRFVTRADLGQVEVASTWGLLQQILLALFS